MFGKLKDKLKGWAKKLSEEAPAEEVEETVKEETTKEEQKKETKKAKEEKKPEKKESKKPQKESKETAKTKTSSKQKQKTPASQDEVVGTQEAKEELKEEFEEKKPTEKLPEEKPEEETQKTKKSILSFFKKQVPEPAPKALEGKKILSPGVMDQTVPASQDEVVDTKEAKKELKEEFEEKEKLLPKKSEEEITPEHPGFFKKFTQKIQKVKITEEDFEIYAEELEMLLLENNVALEVTEKIIKDLKEKLIGREILKKEMESEIEETLKDSIRDILQQPFLITDKIKEKKSQSEDPYVVLFCGINGTGKTTTIAKIADQLKREGFQPVMAAGDTFRSAAIDQIKKHGERLQIPVIASQYGSDPASVGFDAIQYAKKNHKDIVLIDTAGRMHTDKNLLREIEKIAKVTKADTKVFVGESITGNDAIEQVRSFNFAIGIDGIILTKADIDEKGGTALSVGYVTKKPILYLGTGQEYDKIEPFDKEKFIKQLGLDD